MKRAWMVGWTSGALLSVGLLAWIAGLAAGALPTEPVELFAAIHAGEIEARLIPQDEASGTVILTNKGERPLSIRLPEAFAAVPVAAQIRGGGANAGNGRNGNGGNG